MSDPLWISSRDVLIKEAQAARARLFNRIESGSRDFPQMNADLRHYIEYLGAADILGELEAKRVTLQYVPNR